MQANQVYLDFLSSNIGPLLFQAKTWAACGMELLFQFVLSISLNFD